SSRRRHKRSKRDWSSDVCSSDLQAAYDPQQPGRVLEAVIQETGNRDRITGDFGVRAKPWGDEFPVQPGADGQTDGDPSLHQSAEIGRASCRRRVYGRVNDAEGQT